MPVHTFLLSLAHEPPFHCRWRLRSSVICARACPLSFLACLAAGCPSLFSSPSVLLLIDCIALCSLDVHCSSAVTAALSLTAPSLPHSQSGTAVPSRNNEILVDHPPSPRGYSSIHQRGLCSLRQPLASPLSPTRPAAGQQQCPQRARTHGQTTGQAE